MKLRFKILSGFLILALMLLAAGIWSILEIKSAGSTVEKILKENYKSIQAAKLMKESLEREDSGLLLLLLGNSTEGKRILLSADSSFSNGFNIAKGNITISGEREIVERIEQQYSAYKNLWLSSLDELANEDKLDWYFKNIHKSFFALVNNIDRLSGLNDKEMYNTAIDVQSRWRRAVMPGIVAVISAIIFSILFNYFVDYYMVKPIIEITRRVNDFTAKQVPFNYAAETKDELADLTDSIYTLCSYAQKHE